ncbi:MAG: DUF1116 domain-containing protein [Syntrophomonadaceae bacterium]|nr:DUF1116 domain-containing protein [Syntrophomonadaceae bacterium]
MSRIDLANQEAVRRMMGARPVLVDIGRARDVIPGMKDNLFLHAGPPITWDRMSGPLRGAITGGLIYEKMARTTEEAVELAASGEIEFAPCHHYNAVGPMAGVITPTQMVFIIEDKEYGGCTYSNMNEGYGKVLRYGAYDEGVLRRLRWLNTIYAQVLKEAIRLSGGVDMKTLIAQALHMGDEGHNRNRATTSLFIRTLAPCIAETESGRSHDYDCERIDLTNVCAYFKEVKPTAAAEVLAFMHSNDLTSLNAIMAACKSMALAAHGIENSTIVTTMARNGTDFGIRVSSTGDQWFTGPANVPAGLYFSGFTTNDANADIGDSVITETVGIGGFAMAAAPAIVNFIGGKPADAFEATSEMYEITVAENSNFNIPAMSFRGTPTGIDVRKVIEKGILPRINTGIAHKEPGVGQIGAGIVLPPLECFIGALKELAKISGQ